eukprot:TRINITY_DN67504_c0_g1_i1.p1 TRINITY_DN67504_c0_g1~~TRINITY_DN67504_c0_g1_i1.p1  ORF type:complete len:164 (+),score=80.57 TRINITY_DN67504_c0_g1_i1:71-562(+)
MGASVSACVYGDVDWKDFKRQQVEAGACVFGDVQAWEVHNVPVEIQPTAEELAEKARLEKEEADKAERARLEASLGELTQKLARLEQQTDQVHKNEQATKSELAGRLQKVEEKAKLADEGVKKVEEVLEAAKKKAAQKKAGKKKDASAEEGEEAQQEEAPEEQ